MAALTKLYSLNIELNDLLTQVLLGKNIKSHLEKANEIVAEFKKHGKEREANLLYNDVERIFIKSFADASLLLTHLQARYKVTPLPEEGDVTVVQEPGEEAAS